MVYGLVLLVAGMANGPFAIPLSGLGPAAADGGRTPIWCDGTVDTRTGFCYNAQTGVYYNRVGEEYRATHDGEPPDGYFWNDRDELELIEDWSWTLDFCTYDLWIMEIDVCRGTVELGFGPVTISSDPEDNDDDGDEED